MSGGGAERKPSQRPHGASSRSRFHASGSSIGSDDGSTDGTSIAGVKRADTSLSIDDFTVLSKLGEGGFGTVLLVRKKSNGKLYALKVLVKKNMTKSGDAKRAIGESIAMQEIRHPFIVQLHFAFQDAQHIYFVLEFVGGGDLFSHLERGTFPEKWCRIYIAEVALAIQHVHENDFVYRDLKPENVLVGSDGHLVLADFGLAKRLGSKSGGRLNTVIGTPSLLAPELFLEKSYGFSVDWWALGLLFCEMLMGETLIVDEDGDDLHTLIEHFRNGTHLQPVPKWVSRDAADLIRRLLTVDRSKRMCCGSDGFNELKRHPFFKGLDWDALYRKEIEPPLSPFNVKPDTASAKKGKAEGDGPKHKEVQELEAAFTAFANDEEEAGSSITAWSSLLCEAAAAGSVEELRNLINQGAPIDVGDYDRRTAMHIVASEGHLRAAKYLVEEVGANTSPLDRWGGTPLDDAIRSKHKELVEYLTSVGATKGATRADATTSDMCDAAAQGDLGALASLAHAGVDVNKGDYDKRTPIHLAASEGLLEVVKFLVEMGADHSPVDRWGGTPLDDAIRSKHEAVTAYLRTIGARRGTGKAEAASADLCDAAAQGDIVQLKALLEQGVDANKGDYDKRTAIHIAASEGRTDVVKFLVEEASAHHSPLDRWGNTPLDDAIRSKHQEVVAYLTSVHASKGVGAQASKPSENVYADLCDAASKGDLDTLRELVGKGVDVNKGDYDKRTAIHLAASEGLLPVVRYLVEEAGADHSPIDRWGGTPLDDAFRSAHEQVFIYLVSHGAKKGTGKQQPTVADLCEAAAKGDMDELRMLVEQGVKVNKGDYDRRTALHLAASEGLMPVVRFLLDEASAHHSPIDRWGNTPLDDAIRSNHAEVEAYLREHGARTSEKLVSESKAAKKAKTDEDQGMDLCGAASIQNVIALRVLIAQGVDVNQGDYDQRTALHLAASNGFRDVVELLVEEGKAKANPLDRWGYTPLDDALRSGHEAVAEYLRERGAQQGSGHAHKTSADMCDAAAKGDIAELRHLLETGVDVNAGDYDKRTPIHLAASEGLLPVVKFLVNEAGCDVSPLDRWGFTPLDDAIRSKHRDVAEYLAAVGARKKESTMERILAFPRGISGKPRSSEDRSQRGSQPSRRVSTQPRESDAHGGHAPGPAFAVTRQHSASSVASSSAASFPSTTGMQDGSPAPAVPSGGTDRSDANPAAAASGTSRISNRLASLSTSLDSGRRTSVGVDSSAPADAGGAHSESGYEPHERRQLSRQRIVAKPRRLRSNAPTVPKQADRLVCPLGSERFVDPVVAADGYTYERASIQSWMEQHGLVSPITAAPLKSMALLPNHTLLEHIQLVDTFGLAAITSKAAGSAPRALNKVNSSNALTSSRRSSAGVSFTDVSPARGDTYELHDVVEHEHLEAAEEEAERAAAAPGERTTPAGVEAAHGAPAAGPTAARARAGSRLLEHRSSSESVLHGTDAGLLGAKRGADARPLTSQEAARGGADVGGRGITRIFSGMSSGMGRIKRSSRTPSSSAPHAALPGGGPRRQLSTGLTKPSDSAPSPESAPKPIFTRAGPRRSKPGKLPSLVRAPS